MTERDYKQTVSVCVIDLPYSVKRYILHVRYLVSIKVGTNLDSLIVVVLYSVKQAELIYSYSKICQEDKSHVC